MTEIGFKTIQHLLESVLRPKLHRKKEKENFVAKICADAAKVTQDSKHTKGIPRISDLLQAPH